MEFLSLLRACLTQKIQLPAEVWHRKYNLLQRSDTENTPYWRCLTQNLQLTAEVWHRKYNLLQRSNTDNTTYCRGLTQKIQLTAEVWHRNYNLLQRSDTENTTYCRRRLHIWIQLHICLNYLQSNHHLRRALKMYSEIISAVGLFFHGLGDMAYTPPLPHPTPLLGPLSF
jgi:hypothetical protein